MPTSEWKFIIETMCCLILLKIAMFAFIVFFEKVLTSAIPDDAVPDLQASSKLTNGYDSASLGFFTADVSDLANLNSVSSLPSSGSDGVSILPNIYVDELTAAAEQPSSILMMSDSTPPSSTAKYPKPACILPSWALCCQGKLYDRFGKISECFECTILFFSSLCSLLACQLE